MKFNYDAMVTLFYFTDAGITVLCGSDYIGIRALEDFFKYHNVALESLHLPNASCRAEKTIVEGRVYYISRISKEEYIPCGGKRFEVQSEIWSQA